MNKIKNVFPHCTSCVLMFLSAWENHHLVTSSPQPALGMAAPEPAQSHQEAFAQDVLRQLIHQSCCFMFTPICLCRIVAGTQVTHFLKHRCQGHSHYRGHKAASKSVTQCMSCSPTDTPIPSNVFLQTDLSLSHEVCIYIYFLK